MIMKNTTHINDLQALIQQVAVEVTKGIQHGHFEFQITCDGNDNGSRRVVFKAGLSHRYVLDLKHLPKDLEPKVTFESKAQTKKPTALKTSLPDAQATSNTDVESEHRRKRKQAK